MEFHSVCRASRAILERRAPDESVFMVGRVPTYAANIVRREYRQLRRAGMSVNDARLTIWATLCAGRSFKIQFAGTGWQ